VEGDSAETQMTDTGKYQEGTENNTRDAARPRDRGPIDNWMPHQLILSDVPTTH
jgi:hypothetical protein